MREIKFRAWDEENKTFIYFDLSQNPTYWADKLKDFPIQQSTELQDKNGKDIYEGDYLSVNWDDVRYAAHIIGPVEWNTEEAKWELGEGGSPMNDAKNYMTIIGNIYENPGLLNEFNNLNK